MDYLRRMQTERPLLFWAAVMLSIWLGFQLLLFIAGLVLASSSSSPAASSDRAPGLGIRRPLPGG